MTVPKLLYYNFHTFCAELHIKTENCFITVFESSFFLASVFKTFKGETIKLSSKRMAEKDTNLERRVKILFFFIIYFFIDSSNGRKKRVNIGDGKRRAG